MILSLLDFPEVSSLRGLVKLYENPTDSKIKQSIRYRLDSVKAGGKIKFFFRKRASKFCLLQLVIRQFLTLIRHFHHLSVARVVFFYFST